MAGKSINMATKARKQQKQLRKQQKLNSKDGYRDDEEERGDREEEEEDGDSDAFDGRDDGISNGDGKISKDGVNKDGSHDGVIDSDDEGRQIILAMAILITVSTATTNGAHAVDASVKQILTSTAS